MREFTNRVAVVTGAASGIGRALAERCAREGMKVVLADVEEPALVATEQTLRAAGATVLAVRTDVSKAKDVEALAEQALQAFGGVHLLANNAGVAVGTTVWESSVADWEWVMGVNLWGVIHGLRVFVPLMLGQAEDGHIVNTASIAGLIAGPGLGVYKATKHAVVSISETLSWELAERGARIGVSVLCPGWVRTRIVECERNRPVELPRAAEPENADALRQAIHELVEAGTPPEAIADDLFRAIRAGQLYVLTHPDFNGLVQARMETILAQRNPM